MFHLCLLSLCDHWKCSPLPSEVSWLERQIIQGDFQDTCLEKLNLRYKNNSLMMKVPKRTSHLQGMKILGKKNVLKSRQVPPLPHSGICPFEQWFPHYPHSPHLVSLIWKSCVPKLVCLPFPFASYLAENPSNIHFIEQLSGMEGNFPETNLHLSTSFATGTVFSGSFLDSLLATVSTTKPRSPHDQPLA